MAQISDIIAAHKPNLKSYEELYKHFHANPELSQLEHETAKTVCSRLAKFSDYQVHSEIGGTGVAAVLRNGKGPTVLLRADMDALPVEEQTGVPYASTKRMKDVSGVEHPVMHACGHDMHVTALLATAELLYAAREKWAGTLLLIFQPAEEKGVGAKAMVDGGLYDKVPVPDVVLGAHVTAHPAGWVGSKGKAMASAADSIKITVFGQGGHASQPHTTIDAVVLASSIVTRLQTLVSREISPLDAAVVTVASLRAGEAENVIPDRAVLKINVRAFTDPVRDKLLAGIKRIVRAECEASAAIKDPEFEIISSFPLTWNDEKLAGMLDETMREHFGDSWHELGPLPGSEDFSLLATMVDKPSCYWIYGGSGPEVFEKLKKEGKSNDHAPGNHSPYFAPAIQPTLGSGVDAYAVAALTWLAKGRSQS